MNKNETDSALRSLALPDAGWGHALAALGKVREKVEGEAGGRAGTAPQSLADIIGQLPANACHELLAGGKGDAASLLGFGAMLAMLLSAKRENAPCFFVRPLQRRGGRVYPPGLAALGLDPARCFSVHAPDLIAALKATADIARSGAAGAVLVEVEGNPRLLDLTASRRLALAAEQSGTAVLLLRMGAREAPSAAYSRWQICAVPSTPLLAEAPGGPAFAVTLLRHRRMAAGLSEQLIWNPEEWKFDEQAVATQKSDGPQREAGEATFGRLFSLAARRAAGLHPRRAA